MPSVLDRDPRVLPLYPQREAARHIGVPAATLRLWTQEGPGGPPLLLLDDPSGRLSFYNLVEAYIIKQIRTVGDVSMPALRRAAAAARTLDLGRMLLSQRLRWGGDVFWEGLEDDTLVNLSRAGQIAMRDLVEASLNRIEWDEQTRLPVWLSPAIRGLDASRAIVRLDPAVRFGQPSVAGVPTRLLAKRVNAGEALREVAEDYAMSVEDLTAALVYEEVGAA